MATFLLEVSYTQVAVFDSLLVSPFNDWTDAHIAQGFAWRPGSVSFGTLDSGGQLRVEVTQTPVNAGASTAERIISVPFRVPDHGAIEVASIGSSVALELPGGEYDLTFEHGRDRAGAMWAHLHFRRVDKRAAPRVLRSDPELKVPEEFVMVAEPA